MSKDGKSSPHPVIEVRTWDNSGVLGRHLSILAVRLAYAISNFTNSKTGLAHPSLKTLQGIVQVHMVTLRNALEEITRLGVPLQRAGRYTGRRSTGHAFAGPVQWAIVPFNRKTADAYMRMAPQRKRRLGRLSDILLDAHSELSDSLDEAQSEVSDILHSTSQGAPCVDDEQIRNRRRTKDYSKGKELMPSSTKREALGKGVEAKGSARVRGAARWTHTGKPLLGARRRMQRKGVKRGRPVRVR